MAPPPPRAEAAGTATGRGVFAVAAGCFLGIALLKLGNPVLLDAGTMYPPPAGLGEVISEPWPMSWGYVMLAVLAVAGLFVVRKPAANPAWMLWMPALWLGWQLLASARTIDPPLTRLTIAHFVASTACFYLGLCSAGGAGSGLRRVRPGLVAGLLVVLAAGIHQHHGGFESNRRFFEENEMSGWTNVPPAEVRQLEMTRMLVRKPDGSLTVNPAVEHKLASGRIFGTLVYPNALAGVILLLLPLALVSTRDWTRRLGNVPHGALVGSVAYVGIACLYWSGSKSGWLVALALGVLTLLRLPLAKTLKVGLATLLIISGAAGLAIKYRDYFSRGATSAAARLDYWTAAWENAAKHPVLGSGPGTFFAVYKVTKKPESEMARLAHNDYLQQASDSGWPGCLAYCLFIGGSIVLLARRTARDDLTFAVWLGLAGWAMQGIVEFGLYIPASAWTAFLLLGCLWREQPALDSTPETAAASLTRA
ncbi:MAG: O-antigen ligase family protein [Verrucomicrobia bacterium]|nr:O-antigen ligase family protein [Verrucomicrobiota bacterium]